MTATASAAPPPNPATPPPTAPRRAPAPGMFRVGPLDLAVVPLRSALDVSAITVLSLIGIAGFASSFDTLAYLWAGIGGLVVGTVAALISHLLRLPAVLTALAAIVLFYLLGGVFAVPNSAILRFVPTLDTLQQLSVGTVFGWADIITLRAPISLPDYVAAVPYVSTWLVALVGTTLATRWLPTRDRTAWRTALLLIGPFAIYLAGVLMGTDEPFFAALRGVAFAAIALVWLGWRRSRVEQIKVVGATGMLRRRLVGVGIVVIGASLVGVLVGTLLAPPPDNRFVLREEVQPPFEPLDYPSPLSGFRQYTKTDVDTELFTVEGLREGQRLRIATMDSYDGVMWDVAGSKIASDGSGSFALVGRRIPKTTFVTPTEPTEITVTVSGYSDVWVPELGYPTSLSFTDADADQQEADLRYNAATGTTVLTSTLSEGDSYTLTGVEQEAVTDDEELADIPSAALQTPPLTRVPDVVTAKASELAGDATSTIGRLRNIEQGLRTQGFLSHGTASDSVASRAGHGADRMVELFTRSQMIGDQEQYATAFALMANSLGFPSRVVMGFAPEAADGEAVTVTGDDVTAWAEVAFDGVGWVAFDPTPEQTDVPQDQNPKPQTEPQPQVRQPPRTDNDRDDLITAVDVDDSDDDENQLFNLPAWVVILALSLLIPAILIFVPMLIIALVKRRRARKRRAAGGDRAVAGAWDELVDRLTELGYDVPDRGTRIMAGRRIDGQLDARLADRAGLPETVPTGPDAAEPASASIATGPGSGPDDDLGNGGSRVAMAAGGAVTLLAVRTDEAVFSGQEVDAERVDSMWSQAYSTVDGAAAGTTRFRRILARYRIGAARRWASRVARSAQDAASTQPK